MKEKARELGARVKETVQTAQKQLMGLEEEMKVKEKANELGAKVKETVQTAHKQFQGFEDEVQKLVARVQDRLMATPTESIKRVDDLLRTLVVNDFVEKVKAIEMFKQSTAVKKEMLEKFGLVAADEMQGLKESVEQLRTQVEAIQKKTTSLGKRPIGVAKRDFSTLKSRVDSLEKSGQPTARKKTAAAPKSPRKG